MNNVVIIPNYITNEVKIYTSKRKTLTIPMDLYIDVAISILDSKGAFENGANSNTDNNK